MFGLFSRYFGVCVSKLTHVFSISLLCLVYFLFKTGQSLFKLYFIIKSLAHTTIIIIYYYYYLLLLLFVGTSGVRPRLHVICNNVEKVILI